MQITPQVAKFPAMRYIYCRLTGAANLSVLARLVVSYFQTLVPLYHIYHTSYSTFALLYTGEKKNADDLAKQLEQRFCGS